MSDVTTAMSDLVTEIHNTSSGKNTDFHRSGALLKYCRYGNIREIFIFARRPYLRIQESRESYSYNWLLKKNANSQIINFVKSPKNRNSQKFKHSKITRSTV